MANPLCHWELMVNDVPRAKRFYSTIFGWRYRDESPDYIMIDTGAPPGGGLMQRPRGAPMAALNTYFQVDSIDKTTRDVVEAGGTLIVPKAEVPGGWFAMFLDLDGIAVGIFENKPAKEAS